MCSGDYKCRICGNTDNLDRWNKDGISKIMEKEIDNKGTKEMEEPRQLESTKIIW